MDTPAAKQKVKGAFVRGRTGIPWIALYFVSSSLRNWIGDFGPNRALLLGVIGKDAYKSRPASTLAGSPRRTWNLPPLHSISSLLLKCKGNFGFKRLGDVTGEELTQPPVPWFVHFGAFGALADGVGCCGLQAASFNSRPSAASANGVFRSNLLIGRYRFQLGGVMQAP
jgi:hypothetical protein